MIKQLDIYYMLVNKDWNRGILQNVPHILYQDMVIVFYYRGNFFPCLVTNGDMDALELTTEKLEQLAVENTLRALPMHFCNVGDYLDKILENKEDYMGLPFYCMTNTNRYLGAVTVLYPQALKSVSCALQDDLFILPCNIHECIIVPSR